MRVWRAYRGWRGDGAHPFAAWHSRRVYLSFDDGPDPEWTPRILDELRRLGVRATFFVVGERVKAAPELVRRVLAEGHEVELHCMRHERHVEHPRERIEADADDALALLAGLDVRLRRWRPPYNTIDWWTPEVAEDRGLELVGVSADPRDWAGTSVEEMLDLLEPDLRPGRVVVMHDGAWDGGTRNRPDASNTLALLDPLVERIRAQGLEPAPLSAGPAFFWLKRARLDATVRDPGVTVELVVEEELSEADRRAVCELLAQNISRDQELYRARGWRAIPPAFRVLGRVDGEIVAHVASFELETDPPMRAFGSGDHVVRPDHRRKQLAMAVGRENLREIYARDPHILVGDTVAFADLLEKAGWRQPERFHMYYERGGACHWRPTWWVWESPDRPPGRIRLSEPDF